MVIDVTTKNDSTMTIDEFFHQVELGSLQLCYEFELERINLYNLNENSIKTKLADAGLDIVSFFNKLKQKIIDFCKKAVQFLTELLSRGLNNINEIQKSSLLKKYKLDQIKDAIDKVVPDYLKDHPFYDIHELNGIDIDYPSDDIQQIQMSKKVFGEDWFISRSDHSSRTMTFKNSWVKYDDKYIEKLIIKENEYHLVSEIIMNDDIKKSINSDIAICKKHRDKDLKELEDLVHITKEHNKRVADRCNEILKIYSTKLKMILSNAKSKIAILILAKKELEKSDDKDSDESKKNEYPLVSDIFKGVVSKGDLIAIRSYLANYLVGEKDFNLFDQAAKYANNNIDNLYVDHNGEKFEIDKSKWNKDILNTQLVNVVNNFSHERISYIKKLIPVVLKRK